MKTKKTAKKTESVGPDFHQTRISVATFERLNEFRKTPKCVAKYGNYGRPPKIFELATVLLGEALDRADA